MLRLCPVLSETSGMSWLKLVSNENEPRRKLSNPA